MDIYTYRDGWWGGGGGGGELMKWHKKLSTNHTAIYDIPLTLLLWVLQLPLQITSFTRRYDTSLPVVKWLAHGKSMTNPK